KTTAHAIFLIKMESGHVPLSLDWQLITAIRAGQTLRRLVAPGWLSRLSSMHPDNNQDRTWASPAASGPVSARSQLPASKSITNRALVLPAPRAGPSVLATPRRARHTALAAGALHALGSGIAEYRTGWRVSPGPPAPGSAVRVDLGNAGTVMRFVPGLAALT